MDWIDIAEDQGLDQWLLAHRWIAGIGAALSLLLIGFASGIATMFFANWNFRLTREPRALRRTRGLTTRTDVALPVRRVQAAILVTGWFRRRFGWPELRLQSLASDGEKERDHQAIPRSEKRRVGEGCVRTCQARWAPPQSKKKKQKK